jgi:DNA helicase HerA-like ATPase
MSETIEEGGQAEGQLRRSRGRLFGRSVLQAVFRAPVDEDLFLGEILVGEDDATGRRYLFRVVDITYGSEHREPGWAERVAGVLLQDDASGAQAHRLYDGATRTYRVAECACLGYIAPDGKEFRKPKSLPTQFSRVVSPSLDDFRFLELRMGDLRVGKLRSGETEVGLEVGIPGDSLASHVGIFATTGMGKSNLLRVLASAVMSRGGRYGMVLFDPHGEHLPLLSRHPWAAESLSVYSASQRPGANALRVSLAELSLDDLRTAYEWSRPQEEAIYELERHFRKVGLSWLEDLAGIDDLQGFREVELSSRIALSTLQVIHRRARRLVSLEAIATDPQISVGKAILDDLQRGKVVLIHLAGMDSTEEVLVASYLARKVFDTWGEAYRSDPEAHARMPVVALALEEAQRVLSGAATRNRDTNVFARIAREGRKFKVGIVAVTQQPRLLDDELLSQLNTFFVLGVADEKDRSIIRASAKSDMSSLGAEIQTLMPGEALLANLSAPFVVPCRIYRYEEAVSASPQPPRKLRMDPVAVSALVD